MDGACPLCRGTTHHPILRGPVPTTIFAVDGERPAARAEMALVRCAGCGHLFNRAFDEAALPDMYGDAPLTNLPADPSMMDRLRSLTDWLDMDARRGARMIEIGCGAGHLARILARWAERITLFEPNIGLDRTLVPEETIEIRNAHFPLDGSAPIADLIICRQVVEHTPDPAAMLRAIRAALAPGGQAYVEIPGGAFIETHAALADIHLQHVQYFDEDAFPILAARVGLRETRRLVIKDGHDVGFLFAADAPRDLPFPSPREGRERLAERLAGRAVAARAAAAAWPAATALYGATAHGQALLNALDGVRRFDVVFDDNPHIGHLGLYDDHHVVPAVRPTPEAIAGFDMIVITAYLHDEVIARKLRAAGYGGAIVTTRPAPLPDEIARASDLRPLWG